MPPMRSMIASRGRAIVPKHAKPTAKGKGGALRALAVVALFLVGAAVMLYPAYSYLYNEYMYARAASAYQQAVDAGDAQEKAQALDDARAWNAAHTVNVINDPFGEDGKRLPEDPEYLRQLSVPGVDAMAYVDIPAIGQRLPVYHGTSGEVLDKGIGHLSGTSLPVGGDSTHCVLSGHRGLPSKKLFTDLDQLQEGDEFYLHVMGEDLAYRIEDIRVVKPEQVESLAIQPGRDLCTLVTCTPYAVNTHRLLLTGHRVPYVAPDEAQSPFWWLAAFSPQTLALAGAFTIVVIAAFALLVKRMRGREKE